MEWLTKALNSFKILYSNSSITFIKFTAVELQSRNLQRWLKSKLFNIREATINILFSFWFCFVHSTSKFTLSCSSSHYIPLLPMKKFPGHLCRHYDGPGFVGYRLGSLHRQVSIEASLRNCLPPLIRRSIIPFLPRIHSLLCCQMLKALYTHVFWRKKIRRLWNLCAVIVKVIGFISQGE